MRRTYLNNEVKVRHIYEEKKILGDIDHEFMPRLLKTCKDQHEIGMIMSLMAGAPLHKLVQMNKCMPPDVSRMIVIQLIDMMMYLHDRGILYRDLKLSNVLIDSTGRCKLIDFGLSKYIHKGRTKSICGSPHTLPLDIFEEEGYDYSIDHYTIGILLYELLTGRPPYGFISSFDGMKSVSYDSDAIDYSSIHDDTCIDFMKSILHTDRRKRLGCSNGWIDILSHKYISLDRDTIRTYIQHKVHLIDSYTHILDDIDVLYIDDRADSDDNHIDI